MIQYGWLKLSLYDLTEGIEMPHSVYIASAPQDKKIALQICSVLEENGISCWTASRDIVSGVNWVETVAEAIIKSSLVIIVLSRKANEHANLINDLILAHKQDLPVIPLRIDDMEPEGAMQFYLSGAHWMSVTNPPSERQLVHLADTVRTYIMVDQKTITDETNSKELKVRKRKKWVTLFYGLTLLFLTVLIGVALIIETPDKFNFLFTENWSIAQPESIDFTGTRGNSAGNINNMGLAVLQDDWVYYSYIDEGFHLYRESLASGEKSKLNEDQAYYLNVSGDWVYYVNGTDKDAIYKIKTDGTERTKINDIPSEYLVVIGDWIYFADRSEGAHGMIKRMQSDGSNLSTIINESAGYINYVDDSIYYINYNDSSAVYSLEIGSWQQKKLADYDSTGAIVEGPWLYYINYTRGSSIYKISLNGGLPELLNDDHSDYLNIDDGWLYFMSHNRGGGIVKMSVDGSSKPKILNDDYSVYINIVGDWIYYLNRDQGNRLYRMTTDGNDNGPVGGFNQ
jgi:hypothetical protein